MKTITYEKFSVAPIKIRVLLIKKLLNNIGYKLEETYKEDKPYKKALKDYQEQNGFIGNCIINNSVFASFIKNIPQIDSIWNEVINKDR